MSTQLQLLEVSATTMRKPDYDSHTDMWGQPVACEECGAPYRLSGAYLQCQAGHWRYMECVGRDDHPLFTQFCAYRRSIGHPID